MPRALTVLACLTVLAAAAPAARAVVPGAARVLETAAEAAPHAEPFVANLVEAPPDRAAPRLAMRIASDGAGRLRVDRQLLGAAETTTTWYGPVGAPGVQPLDSAPLWILYLAGRPLEPLLAARQVDRDRTSLDHADEIVLWVLGAGPREPDRPQLAVERDSGRLRRLVERTGPPESAIVTTTTLSGSQAAEGPASRWPERVTTRTGEAEPTHWRVAWLRFGEAPDASELSPPAPPPVPGAP